MLSGVFARNLRKLNPELRVWCGDSDHLPAGLFRVHKGEYDQICSVDKQWVPEHPIFDEEGFIKKGGWRRTIGILLRKGLVDRRRAERIFMTTFPVVPRNYKVVEDKKPKHKLLDKYVERYLTPEEAKKMALAEKGR